MNIALACDRVLLPGSRRPISGRIQLGEKVVVLATDSRDGVAFCDGLANAEEGVYRYHQVFLPGGTPPPRVTVQARLKQIAGKQSHSPVVTDALIQAGLEDDRLSLARSVDRSQLCVGEALASPDPVVVFPYLLDLLSPWRLPSAVEALGKARTLVIATNRTEILSQMDTVVVLHQGGVAFWDSLDKLLRTVMPPSYRLVSNDHSAAAAVAERFRVVLRETEEGWEFSAPHGQELAAQMLTFGYGAIDAIVEKLPSLRQILDAVVEATEHGIPLPHRPRPKLKQT